MKQTDPTERFTDRADHYARYRPGYPSAVLETLRQECGLTPQTVVADVGSGTGILTELFLKQGNKVYAVEPNDAMRLSAERALAGYSLFTSVAGRAEATTLPDASVDLVAAGQAFHWFDAPAARIEFKRILRPGGWVALVWNTRSYRDYPFMSAYEATLADFGLGYHAATHPGHDGDMNALFTRDPQSRRFQHGRTVDWATLWGGFLSASYAPAPGDPRYESMHHALRNLFERYERAGQVELMYDTSLFFGNLD